MRSTFAQRARSLIRLTTFELSQFIREPIGTFFTIAFPVILLLTIGSAFGDVKVDIGSYRYVDVYVPALYGMIIANLGLMSVPIVLSEYRESGFLKTLLATSLTRTRFVTAQSVAHGAVAIAASILVAITAKIVFGLQFGGSVAAILAFMCLGALAFFATGHVIAGAFRSVRSAQAVGSATFFLMLFLSGAAIPRQQFPLWLARLGGLLPLAQLVDPLVNIWTGESFASQWSHALYLLVMAILAIVVAQRLQALERN